MERTPLLSVNPTDDIAVLRQAGWMIRTAEGVRPLPEHIVTRYPLIPEAVQRFQTGFSLVTNADETSWFLLRDDYAGESGSVFQWNEFESMSLDDGESPEDKDRIRAFWDRHYPFFLSVKASSYVYFALDLGSTPPGRVVHGMDPFFEDPHRATDSFEDFLAELCETALGKGGHDLLRLVI